MFLFVFSPTLYNPYENVFSVMAENADDAKVAVLQHIKQKLKSPVMMEEFERDVITNQIENWEDAIRDKTLPSPYSLKSFNLAQVVESIMPAV